MNGSEEEEAEVSESVEREEGRGETYRESQRINDPSGAMTLCQVHPFSFGSPDLSEGIDDTRFLSITSGERKEAEVSRVDDFFDDSCRPRRSVLPFINLRREPRTYLISHAYCSCPDP